MHDLIQIKIVETEDEMREVHSLRYEVFGKEFGYIKKENPDPYDKIAFNILAIRNGIPAGSVRIIDDRHLALLDEKDGVIFREGRVKFPIEKEANLDLYRKNGRQLIELSRLVVPRYERGISIASSLLAACYHYVKKNSVTDGFIIANCEMHSRGKIVPEDGKIKIPSLFKKLGFQEIGSPFYYKDFSAWAVKMHLPIEKVSKTLKSMHTIAEKKGILPCFKKVSFYKR
jgi:hypothetical protein